MMDPLLHCMWVLLLLCGWHLPCADCAHEETKTFIGWKGEAYKPEVLWNPTRKQGGDHSKEWVELLSWSPRAFVYHNLLSSEECDHLQAAAVPTMKVPSSLETKEIEDVGLRSSYETSLPRAGDAVVEKVHTKVAEWLGVPSIHHEDVQVFQAQRGNLAGEINFEEKSDEQKHDGNPRIATVLLFLSSVESGGETVFPDANWADPGQQARNGPWSSCAAGDVAVKPRKGDALLFFSIWPNGYFDQHSSHHDCPVQEGSKWTGTVQIHASPWHMESFERTLNKNSVDPGECVDRNSMCPTWAKDGLCKSNEEFMVGDKATRGVCRLACKACEVCDSNDKECLQRNRERSGYLSTPVLTDTTQTPRRRHAPL